MTEPAAPASGSIESVSALGLMVGGAAGAAASVAAAAFGVGPSDLVWWMWAIPLWAVVALPLGWKLRRRAAPAPLRNIGRVWLVAAAAPLIFALSVGKPVAKGKLQDMAAPAAAEKVNP
jgi:hypothetical protein